MRRWGCGRWFGWRGRLGCLPESHDVADLAQIVGQDAKADPALHAGLAVVAAARQAEAALEHADAALDPGPEAVRPSEARLPLERLPTWAERPRLGDGDAPHALLHSHTLIGRGMEGAIGRDHVRWSTEAGAVLGQARRQLIILKAY